MDTNILLESGTNELEILEFTVDGNYYGINVAKIREILSFTPLTLIPNGHPSVEGAFSTRGDTITVINLAKCLGLQTKEQTPSDMFLITTFNGVNTGFHVHSVVGIHRVNWSQIIKPDRLISNSSTSIMTGIINIDGKLIILLDFENIVAQIAPDVGIQLSDVKKLGEHKTIDKPILYAEDSQLLSSMIYDGLTEAGFTRLKPLNNGMELWEALEQYREEGTLKENVACIVTDIEMPQMDGHRLLKLVKEHPDYRDIPVIVFSSLINEDMRRKGESLGADAQLSKGEMGEFVKTLTELLSD
ncbi:MAG: chemotaxis protein CheV [Lachnospiraceae bacterium]|nr:chemotaxis protein CheV [Lachnospiraceae bacterium]